MVFTETPVLCGHRGSGKGVVAGQRENTIGSHRAAVAAGLDWVEVDARLTADDVLVAHHDPAIDGRFVAELTADETDALGLMRVADLLEDLPPRVGVDVDVKSALEDALRPRELTTAAHVAGLVAGEGERRPLLVTSFDPAALLIVRERAPRVPIGLLTWGRFPLRKAIAAAAQLGTDVVGPHVESFPVVASEERPVEHAASHSVDVAHQAGLQVLAWCPRDEAEARALVDAGVDCLVIDDVPAAVTLS
jgi:glycerophosphoryl diester phosphodiesterase